MTRTSNDSNDDLNKATTRERTSSFGAALAHDPSAPAPELAGRLDADMARVFHSPPSETSVESDPAREPAPAAYGEVCDLLNQCLANCIDLRLQCKQAQWEMGGSNGDALVRLFARTAVAIEAYADGLSARITALGGVADGRLDTVAERSGLNHYPDPDTRDLRHVDAVASTLAVAVVSLRSEFADLAGRCDRQTSELLQELARGLESHCAHMQV